MAQTSNIHMYTDVRDVLDAAIANGGARFTPLGKDGLPSHAAAVRWRFRAYFLRKELQKLEKARIGDLPGHQPRTPYDSWTFRIDPPGGMTVVIEPLTVRGQLETLDGKPLAVAAAEAVMGEPTDDALLEEIEKLNLEIPE